MKIKSIVLKDGFFEKRIQFADKANMIYSQKNTTGKTTFLRSLIYTMGYPVPSTKGICFDDMDFSLVLENDGHEYEIYRHASYLSIDDGCQTVGYSLPSDFYEAMRQITGCDNKDIINNLLGAFYLDQEKGWTLLNRGKVIGNISFKIEELVRGLGGKDCSDEIQRLEAVKRQLKKYEYMYSVSKYQEEINEAGDNLVYDTADEITEKKIEILKAEKAPISEELNQIKDILRKNKVLVEYISDMKLSVRSRTGEEIPVTRETLVGFEDNNDLLVTRREMLASELARINNSVRKLESKKSKEETIFNVQTVIEEFDSDISKIQVDAIATKQIIDRLKKERKIMQERIKQLTKEDNPVVVDLHNCISAYAKELGVSETYVSPNQDYIFTNDLKSLSGTILHKIVFAFRLAYLKEIKEKTGIILPIILDSPSGREVEISTIEKMLQIIQRDYSDHQLIVASIYNFNLHEKNVIEFKNRLFENEDIIQVS